MIESLNSKQFYKYLIQSGACASKLRYNNNNTSARFVPFFFLLFHNNLGICLKICIFEEAKKIYMNCAHSLVFVRLMTNVSVHDILLCTLSHMRKIMNGKRETHINDCQLAIKWFIVACRSLSVLPHRSFS